LNDLISRPTQSDIIAPDLSARSYSDQKEPTELIKSEVVLHPTIVHGLPASSIAKLLAPKPALCGQDLEVTVNDLTFLGHPVKFDLPSAEDGEVKKKCAEPFRYM
jgi:hypothetical protein